MKALLLKLYELGNTPQPGVELEQASKELVELINKEDVPEDLMQGLPAELRHIILMSFVVTLQQFRAGE